MLYISDNKSLQTMPQISTRNALRESDSGRLLQIELSEI